MQGVRVLSGGTVESLQTLIDNALEEGLRILGPVQIGSDPFVATMVQELQRRPRGGRTAQS